MGLRIKKVKNRAKMTQMYFRDSYWSIKKVIQILKRNKNKKKFIEIKKVKIKTSTHKNNLFINKVSNCFSIVYNMIIENNIFYGAEPQGGTGCVFNNNITYMCINNTIPGSGNLGSGNLVNMDPQFVNYPVAGGAFSYSYDFHLKSSSPGKNAGTGGTDIGIYGGIMPYEVGANPHFPQMMEISLPNGSSVPAGGVLDVFFKAKKLN